jgi:hypothetical protein
MSRESRPQPGDTEDEVYRAWLLRYHLSVLAEWGAVTLGRALLGGALFSVLVAILGAAAGSDGWIACTAFTDHISHPSAGDPRHG